jgi:uncharacterized protein (TIGR04255 family)
MAEKLPSFERPPVVEVVIGVQFHALSAFLAPHMGLFWETIRSRYPTCKESPTISAQLEDFTRAAGIGAETSIEIMQTAPLPRVFFEEPSGEWLIQVQRDRFLHNWRLISQHAYPRYTAVKPAFVREWKNFCNFVQDSNLGEIHPIQYEITYLNQISTEDVGDVFPDFKWDKKGKTIPSPESTSISCSFVARDKKSRLRASIRPAWHLTLGSILVFELTVRGFDADADLEEWFDSGRKWIVTAFAEFTSPKWHKQWGRLQ